MTKYFVLLDTALEFIVSYKHESLLRWALALHLVQMVE